MAVSDRLRRSMNFDFDGSAEATPLMYGYGCFALVDIAAL
jgi:hypothetical protein